MNINTRNWWRRTSNYAEKTLYCETRSRNCGELWRTENLTRAISNPGRRGNGPSLFVVVSVEYNGVCRLEQALAMTFNLQEAEEKCVKAVDQVSDCM